MSHFGLSPRDLRAALSGLIAVGGLLMMGHVMPALRDAERAALARAERAVSVIRQAESKLKQARFEAQQPLRSAESLRKAAHMADTPVGGAVLAIAQITDLARTVGASLLAVRPEGDVQFREGAALVKIHLQLAMDGERLRVLLEQIERGPTLYRVESLRVVQSTPMPAPGEPETLQIDLTLMTVAVEAGGREIE